MRQLRSFGLLLAPQYFAVDLQRCQLFNIQAVAGPLHDFAEPVTSAQHSTVVGFSYVIDSAAFLCPAYYGRREACLCHKMKIFRILNERGLPFDEGWKVEIFMAHANLGLLDPVVYP